LLADLVKFARARPGDETHDNVLWQPVILWKRHLPGNTSENTDETNGPVPAYNGDTQEQENFGGSDTKRG
jgi:hypothetical protein